MDGIGPRTSTWLVRQPNTMSFVLKSPTQDVHASISWTLHVTLLQQLLYRDQGVNKTCKRGEAIRVSAPSRPPRASLGPLALLLGQGPLLLLVEA